MKRSFLFSALVLALAALTPACAGGSGDGPKDPTDEKKDEGSGDAIADLKSTIDGIQKEIDGVFEPIKTADAVIDGVAKLPADLKSKAKGKFDAKKLMAEAQKIVEGAEYNLDALGLEGEAKTTVGERFDKLKALITSIKTLDEKVKGALSKAEALPGKLPGAVAQAAKSAAKAKMPFGVSDADKKKAEEDVKTVESFKTDIPKKVEGWKKDATDMPAKAKDLPAKMKAAFSKA